MSCSIASTLGATAALAITVVGVREYQSTTPRATHSASSDLVAFDASSVAAGTTAEDGTLAADVTVGTPEHLVTLAQCAGQTAATDPGDEDLFGAKSWKKIS